MSLATPKRQSISRVISVRQLDLHVRCWGDPGGPALVLLHGWMDTSASFQFMVDSLDRRYTVFAPDWRGFGESEDGPGDCYWFPDYIADLEQLLDVLVGPKPVVLVGHSMGGNIAMLYAGIRPQRVRCLVNLEGFGLQDADPAKAPDRYVRWLDQMKQPAPMRSYASISEVVGRLRMNNPRLDASMAQFLAEHNTVALPDGTLRIAADGAHKLVNPIPYRAEEVLACWRRIACPVLWIEGSLTDAHKWAGSSEEVARRRNQVRTIDRLVIEGAGHMLHHDRPQEVAQSIDSFLKRFE